METEPLTAADGRRNHPEPLLSVRLAATVLLVAGNVWMVLEYLEFWNTLVDVTPYGPTIIPLVAYEVHDYGRWAQLGTTLGVIAAIIYIWGFAQRVLPVILATVGAAALCAVVGRYMQDATDEAWKWDNGRHERSGSHWERLLQNW